MPLRNQESVEPKRESEFYPTYHWHASTLRAWLVGYGIGAPVLFLGQAKCSDRLMESACFPWIAGLFLAGVGIQVLLAFLNKTVMWLNYYGESEEGATFRQTCRYRWAKKLAWCYCIDFFEDLLTIGLFGWATISACYVVFTLPV